jgi:hypothetical protein
MNRERLLWGGRGTLLYQRFQQAAVVPRTVALETDTLLYAPWLVYTSGTSHRQVHTRERSAEFLESPDPDDRARVADWLAGIIELGSR